eukprot:8324110-Karenia_brevis.AAC.1
MKPYRKDGRPKCRWTDAFVELVASVNHMIGSYSHGMPTCGRHWKTSSALSELARSSRGGCSSLHRGRH